MCYAHRRIGQAASRTKFNSICVTQSTPHENSVSIRFDECTLLDNHIDRMAEDIDKMNTRPQGRQNQQNTLYKLYIKRGRSRHHRNYPRYDRWYDRGRENFRQWSYDRNEREYFSFRGRPRGYNSPKGYLTEDGTIVDIKVTVDNEASEVNPGHQLIDLEFYQGAPEEIKTEGFNCKQFGHFAKDCLQKDTSSSKVWHRE